MADIRVERKSGGRAWLWVLLVVVLLIVAALLLDRAGYIDLPVNLGALDAVPAGPVQLASAAAVVHLQEA
jgi:putative copper export protein